jgi:hypothetical protein
MLCFRKAQDARNAVYRYLVGFGQAVLKRLGHWWTARLLIFRTRLARRATVVGLSNPRVTIYDFRITILAGRDGVGRRSGLGRGLGVALGVGVGVGIGTAKAYTLLSPAT